MFSVSVTFKEGTNGKMLQTQHYTGVPHRPEYTAEWSFLRFHSTVKGQSREHNIQVRNILEWTFE